MHETRYDWLADRWVIFAPNREDRPNEFKPNSHPCEASAADGTCPFCFGSESETPEPTLILPAVDVETSRPLQRSQYDRELKGQEHTWRVRVVPNKFPAIARSATYSHEGVDRVRESSHRWTFETQEFNQATVMDPLIASNEIAILDDDASHLFRKEKATGCHEVIIESPSHVDSLTGLSVEQIALVLEAYRMRLSHWRSQQNLQCAVIFKNYGADAGASLSHSHSQLIGLDFIPSDIQRMHRRLVEHYERYGACYICEITEQELRAKERVVIETEHFVVLCPFASRFPFAFSLIPKTHRCHFEEQTEKESAELASLLKRSLLALERAQPSAAYNYVLQTSPFHQFHPRAHHWRLRVIPRLSKVAGFEWGSDCFINTTKPEVAAEALRSFLD